MPAGTIKHSSSFLAAWVAPPRTNQKSINTKSRFITELHLNESEPVELDPLMRVDGWDYEVASELNE